VGRGNGSVFEGCGWEPLAYHWSGRVLQLDCQLGVG
jgi:hypothetical protein